MNKIFSAGISRPSLPQAPLVAPVQPAAPSLVVDPPRPQAPVCDELAPLLAASISRRRLGATSVARSRAVGVRQAWGVDQADDAMAAGKPVVAAFGYSDDGQSSEGGNGAGNGPAQPRLPFDREGSAGFDPGHTNFEAHGEGHMARSAAGLPARCAAHCLENGSQAMPAFLRSAMVALLPGFICDLADKLNLLDGRPEGVRASEAMRPVGEVFAEFLDFLRPVYARYTSDILLLSDVRDTLCSVQELLQKEVRLRTGIGPALTRVLTDTVHPLLPVFALACMPRPGRQHTSQAPDIRAAA